MFKDGERVIELVTGDTDGRGVRELEEAEGGVSGVFEDVLKRHRNIIEFKVENFERRSRRESEGGKGDRFEYTCVVCLSDIIKFNGRAIESDESPSIIDVSPEGDERCIGE